MEPTHRPQVCQCRPEGDPGVEFQKILDCEETGIVIYRYVPITRTDNACYGESFVIRNTKQHPATPEDFRISFERNKMDCPRCIKILEHVESLVKYIPLIESQDVVSICDHCLRKERPRSSCWCRRMVDKFLIGRQLEDRESIRHRIKLWLKQAQQVLRNAADCEMYESKSKILVRSDADLNVTRKILRWNSAAEISCKKCVLEKPCVVLGQTTNKAMDKDETQDVHVKPKQEPTDRFFASVKLQNTLFPETCGLVKRDPISDKAMPKPFGIDAFLDLFDKSKEKREPKLGIPNEEKQFTKIEEKTIVSFKVTSLIDISKEYNKPITKPKESYILKPQEIQINGTHKWPSLQQDETGLDHVQFKQDESTDRPPPRVKVRKNPFPQTDSQVLIKRDPSLDVDMQKHLGKDSVMDLFDNKNEKFDTNLLQDEKQLVKKEPKRTVPLKAASFMDSSVDYDKSVIKPKSNILRPQKNQIKGTHERWPCFQQEIFLGRERQESPPLPSKHRSLEDTMKSISEHDLTREFKFLFPDEIKESSLNRFASSSELLKTYRDTLKAQATEKKPELKNQALLNERERLNEFINDLEDEIIKSEKNELGIVLNSSAYTATEKEDIEDYENINRKDQSRTEKEEIEKEEKNIEERNRIREKFAETARKDIEKKKRQKEEQASKDKEVKKRENEEDEERYRKALEERNVEQARKEKEKEGGGRRKAAQEEAAKKQKALDKAALRSQEEKEAKLNKVFEMLENLRVREIEKKEQEELEKKLNEEALKEKVIKKKLEEELQKKELEQDPAEDKQEELKKTSNETSDKEKFKELSKKDILQVISKEEEPVDVVLIIQEHKSVTSTLLKPIDETSKVGNREILQEEKPEKETMAADTELTKENKDEARKKAKEKLDKLSKVLSVLQELDKVDREKKKKEEQETNLLKIQTMKNDKVPSKEIEEGKIDKLKEGRLVKGTVAEQENNKILKEEAVKQSKDSEEKLNKVTLQEIETNYSEKKKKEEDEKTMEKETEHNTVLPLKEKADESKANEIKSKQKTTDGEKLGKLNEEILMKEIEKNIKTEKHMKNIKEEKLKKVLASLQDLEKRDREKNKQLKEKESELKEKTSKQEKKTDDVKSLEEKQNYVTLLEDKHKYLREESVKDAKSKEDNLKDATSKDEKVKDLKTKEEGERIRKEKLKEEAVIKAKENKLYKVLAKLQDLEMKFSVNKKQIKEKESELKEKTTKKENKSYDAKLIEEKQKDARGKRVKDANLKEDKLKGAESKEEKLKDVKTKEDVARIKKEKLKEEEVIKAKEMEGKLKQVILSLQGLDSEKKKKDKESELNVKTIKNEKKTHEVKRKEQKQNDVTLREEKQKDLKMKEDKLCDVKSTVDKQKQDMPKEDKVKALKPKKEIVEDLTPKEKKVKVVKVKEERWTSKGEKQKDEASRDEKLKDVTLEEKKFKDVKLKEEKRKDVTAKEEHLKDSSTKERRIKDLMLKEEKLKDEKSKDEKLKEVRSKQDNPKYVTSKENEVKDISTKEGKIKDAISKTEKINDFKTKEERRRDATLTGEKQKEDKVKDVKSNYEKHKNVTSKEEYLKNISTKEGAVKDTTLKQERLRDITSTGEKQKEDILKKDKVKDVKSNYEKHKDVTAKEKYFKEIATKEGAVKDVTLKQEILPDITSTREKQKEDILKEDKVNGLKSKEEKPTNLTPKEEKVKVVKSKEEIQKLTGEKQKDETSKDENIKHVTLKEKKIKGISTKEEKIKDLTSKEEKQKEIITKEEKHKDVILQENKLKNQDIIEERRHDVPLTGEKQEEDTLKNDKVKDVKSKEILIDATLKHEKPKDFTAKDVKLKDLTSIENKITDVKLEEESHKDVTSKKGDVKDMSIKARKIKEDTSKDEKLKDVTSKQDKPKCVKLKEDTVKDITAKDEKLKEVTPKEKKAKDGTSKENKKKIPERPKPLLIYKKPEVAMKTKEIKSTKRRKALIIDLIRLKQSQYGPREKFTGVNEFKLSAAIQEYTLYDESDLSLELMDLETVAKHQTDGNVSVIIGNKIFKQHFEYRIGQEFNYAIVTATPTETKTIPFSRVLQPTKHTVYRQQVDPDAASTKGIIRYALSDRSFIDKGWTMLPTEKVVRKMNVYRMRPAHPEFDWFEHNKYKRVMQYDTGEVLADFDDDGRGRWFYRSGKVALDYYNAEEINAQQRFVVYSSGEPDDRGRTRPRTVLATFDYLGNGVVFDHGGKIRLKYNQTEGIVLDRSIGPVSNWKWHTLNDPPVLQQVMIDTQMPYKDPNIVKLGGTDKEKVKHDNEEMLAIEFDNFIKEKSRKLTQKFKPFQIKMKALKINEYFSLRVLDQATVYLLFRDGATNIKINIGMVLDHKEIVDTDTAEVGEVSNSLERLPARTDSLAVLQRAVVQAQRTERARVRHERRLNPPEQPSSADQLRAGAARPTRRPLLTESTEMASNTQCPPCPCRKPSTTNLYYNTCH